MLSLIIVKSATRIFFSTLTRKKNNLKKKHLEYGMMVKNKERSSHPLFKPGQTLYIF